MKYKVLYLTYHPQIGGGETALMSLITNSTKINPSVVIAGNGQFYRTLKNKRIPAYIVPFSGYLIRELFIPGFSVKELIRLINICSQIKPDIIHINHLNLAVYAGITGKKLKIPVVATAHGPWDSIYPFQDWTTEFCTNLILANSKNTYNSLIKRNIINRDKIKIISFGIDTNRFKPADKIKSKSKLNINKNTFVVSIVGRIDPAKDQLNFLKAANIIIKEKADIKFLVAGSILGDFSKTKYINKLKEFLKENPQVKKNTVFTGFVDEIENIYNASDIVVSSSLSESFGLSSIEAGSCGVPVVATNNPKAIAGKVIYLLENRKLRKKLGGNLRKQVIRDFNINRYIKSVEDAYSQIYEK